MPSHKSHLAIQCVLAWCIAGWCFTAATARAQDVTATLTTAWEMLWHQSGSTRVVYKWQTPLRVKFSGVAVERHKAATLAHLRETAQHAGIEVTEVAADDASANVHVEFFGAAEPLPDNEPCVTNTAWRNGVMASGRIRANDQAVWRCMLHETMHLMGFTGHPMRHSILSYFARSGRLTDVDKLMLKTLYAPEVPSGVSPFALLQSLAQRAVNSAPEAEQAASRQAADAFLRKTISDMEAFGHGTGEVPTVIVRSGKATAQGIQSGQTAIQFFLGLAYLRGHIVAPDKDKALLWLNKAAAASHGGAVALLKTVAQKSE